MTLDQEADVPGESLFGWI